MAKCLNINNMNFKNLWSKMGNKKNKKTDKVEETMTKDEQVLNTENNEEITENQQDSSSSETVSLEDYEKVNNELKEAKDKYLRLFAEFDNFRKRTNKEKLELRKTAAEDTLSALLPVLDDFSRAKKNHDDEASSEQFTEGVILVFDKFENFMKNQGIEAVDPTGDVFNPDYHEAITEIDGGKDMKGKVIDTIERGYKLNDKIIKFAKVVVGK